jgi:hypothetical protein
MVSQVRSFLHLNSKRRRFSTAFLRCGQSRRLINDFSINVEPAAAIFAGQHRRVLSSEAAGTKARWPPFEPLLELP